MPFTDASDIAAVRAEQLRMHRVITPSSVAAGGLLALILAAVLWKSAPRVSTLGWLVAVMAALGARAWLARAHRQSADGPDTHQQWLQRFRLGYAAHGLAWGMSSVLLFPAHNVPQQMLMCLVLTVIVAGALNFAAFDLKAGLLFAVPTLAPLVVRLAAAGHDTAIMMAGVVLLSLVFITINTSRASRNVRDSMALRQAETARADAARRNEELLDRSGALANVGGWELELPGRTLRWTAQTCRIHDLEPGHRPTLQQAMDHHRGESRAELERALHEACEHGTSFDLELPLTTATGRAVWVRTMCSPQWQDGRVVRLSGAMQDVTASRQTDRALAEQNHLFSLLVRNTQQGLWFIDTEYRTTDVNPAMCALLGRAREDIIGRHILEFVDEPNAQIFREQMAARAQGQTAGYEIALLRPDGGVVRCFNNPTPIHDTQGQRVGSVGLWTDLTMLKRAEDALRVYELAVNSITDMVSVISKDNVVLLVNDAWCRNLGLQREHVVGRLTRELQLPLGDDAHQRAMRECMEQRQPQVVRTKEMDQGRPRYREATFYPYRGDASGPDCVVMVTRDVTEQEEGRAALGQSVENLQRTLNATGDAIFASDALDANEPVLFANAQVFKLWGIPPEKTASLSPAVIMEYARPLFIDPAQETARIGQIIASGEPQEDRLRLVDGRVLLRRCIPTVDAKQAVRVWGFRDITGEELALQAARASAAEQRMLLDAFPGFIAAVDENFVYTYVNDRVAALLGRPADQIVGATMREIQNDAAYAENMANIEMARSGQRAVVQRHYAEASGRPRLDLEIHYVIGVDRGNGRQTIFAFGSDVTDRMRAEEALVAAKEEAERANLAKSQFLSSMSHELRTPLNAILGFGQLLEMDPAHTLPERQRGFVKEILRGGRHLLELINEVLDLARIEAGKLPISLEPVRVSEVMGDCLNLLQPVAREHGIAVHQLTDPARDCMVLADRTRLKQVLLNLVANAIKYNRKGGSVGLACVAEGDIVRISVSDRGRGLSQAHQQRLFRAFDRLDADGTDVEGTGIGLALSQRLVHAMQGEIGVDSMVGAGSTFWVKLRRAEPPAPAANSVSGLLALSAPQPVAVPVAPLRTVLYIEDNPVNAVLMEAMLARLPEVRLIVAPLPGIGLDMARLEQPELILLDIQLPGMDGYEVLRRLHSDDVTAHIPVIAVSANAMASDVAQGFDAGFAEYLTKPIEMPQLLAAVSQALGRRANASHAG